MKNKSYLAQPGAGAHMPIIDSARISVVIPAYNGAAFLPATLQSVFAQSAPPGEIIVVDDGSSDDTASIARSFGVTVISIANGGVSAARNVGTLAARGELIAYLDADDIWSPEKLAVQLAALESYGNRAFSLTDYREFNESGFRKRRSELRRYSAFRKVAGVARRDEVVIMRDNGKEPVLYDSSYFAPSTLLVRRTDVLTVGGFDKTLDYCEDYEFFLRLFKISPAVVVMKPLLFYRKHAAQVTTKRVTMLKEGYFDVARRVAAAPERYPRGDVRYIAQTAFFRHYRIGIQNARLGQFEHAAASFERSLAARWSAPASIGLLGSRICRSQAGRWAFDAVRALWKRRPGRH